MELFSPPSSKGAGRPPVRTPSHASAGHQHGLMHARTPSRASAGQQQQQQHLLSVPKSPNPFLKSPSARLLARTSPFHFSSPSPVPQPPTPPEFSMNDETVSLAPAPTRTRGSLAAASSSASVSSSAPSSSSTFLPNSYSGLKPAVTAAAASSAAAGTTSKSAAAAASAAMFAAGAPKRRTAFAAAASSSFQQLPSIPIQPQAGSIGMQQQHPFVPPLRQRSLGANSAMTSRGRVSTPQAFNMPSARSAQVSMFAHLMEPESVAEDEEIGDDDDDDGVDDDSDLSDVNDDAVGARPSHHSSQSQWRGGGGGDRADSSLGGGGRACAAADGSGSQHSSLVPLPPATARSGRGHGNDEYVAPREIFSRSDPLPLARHRQAQMAGASQQSPKAHGSGSSAGFFAPGHAPAPPPSRAGLGGTQSSIRARRVVPDLQLRGGGVLQQQQQQPQPQFQESEQEQQQQERHFRDLSSALGSADFASSGAGARFGGNMGEIFARAPPRQAVRHGRRRFSTGETALDLDYTSVGGPALSGGGGENYDYDEAEERVGSGMTAASRFESTEAFAAAAFGAHSGGGNDGVMDAAELDAALQFAEKLRLRREERLAREQREQRMLATGRSKRSMLADSSLSAAASGSAAAETAPAPAPLPSPSKRGSGQVSFFRAPPGLPPPASVDAAMMRPTAPALPRAAGNGATTTAVSRPGSSYRPVTSSR